MRKGLCLTPSCVHLVFLFADLAEVQDWHSCESGLAAWDILMEPWPTCESKHLSNKCSAWVSLCLIKCVAVKSESLGSWLNLPIVSYLPRETQAALKQGHIFAGYFGLICKSIDVKRTRECLISCPTHLKTGYLGLRAFNCHVYRDNTPHHQGKKRLKRDKQALDGTSLQWIPSQRSHCLGHQRRFNGTCHKPIRLTWHFVV